MTRIRAKVASIISDSQVAFNAGSDDGVVEGAVIKLLKSTEVIDPDTQELLGTVSITKLNLQVNHVQEKLCVARVTDMQPSAEDSLTSITKIRRRKRVVSSPFEEEPGKTVLVSIGEEARIELPSTKEDAELPF